MLIDLIELESSGTFTEEKYYELSYYLEPREGKDKGEKPKLLEEAQTKVSDSPI